MEAFIPSPLESTAATALLLLSFSKPCPPPSSSFSCPQESSSSSVSDSCSSAITTEDSDKTIPSDQLQAFAMAAHYHEKKLKKVRSHSKKCVHVLDRKRIFISRKKKLVLLMPTMSEAEENSSISDQMRRSRLKQKASGGRKKDSAESTRLRTRAEAILKFLSAGRTSEVRIREAIGNSPDTSKALRMLLRSEEVKRSGAGGRMDPFLYAVAGPRSDVDSA